ncbi:type VII secretion protein EccB [Streptomyces sp. NPDC058319]|uniref:type VII secretion protein EccB n=1 Tax=unclassified Streptomyces TaxID=2593676 RepID=UPI0036E3F76F
MAVQSRKDQVQAHLFVLGRLSGSMLRGDPDAPETPSARTSKGMLWGGALVALACLGTAVFGLVSPGGGTSWRVPGTLVVVRETGARYLYTGGALHPVLNEASARLLAGDRFRVADAAADSLQDTPRGATLGIVGAPDALPHPVRRPVWAVCAGQTPAAPGTGAKPLTSVLIDAPGDDGGLGSGRGVLVTAPGAGVQLLWNGRRFSVDTRNGTQAALGWAGVVPTAVSPAFLGTLDAGPALTPPDVPGRGRPGPRLGGTATRVGQLFTASGQSYLLRADGLVPLTGLGHRLLRGDPRTQRLAYGGRAVAEHPVGPADLAAHQAPAAAAAELAAGLPRTAPRVDAVDPAAQQICVRDSPQGDGYTTTVAVVDAASVPGTAPAAQPAVGPACTPADRVWVRPGSGALVRAESSAGTGDSRYLVPENGVAYPLAPTALKSLGYSDSSAIGLPARLLGLLPRGPVLDPTALAVSGVVAPTSAAPPSGEQCGGATS